MKKVKYWIKIIDYFSPVDPTSVIKYESYVYSDILMFYETVDRKRYSYDTGYKIVALSKSFTDKYNKIENL